MYKFSLLFGVRFRLFVNQAFLQSVYTGKADKLLMAQCVPVFIVVATNFQTGWKTTKNRLLEQKLF